MKPIAGSYPVMSCAEAGEFEKDFFHGDENQEWVAMQHAGRAVSDALLRDFAEIGGFPHDGILLVLVGKGHNGGDALLAAQALLERFPETSAQVLFAFGERTLRPLAQRAWRQLLHAAPTRVRVVKKNSLQESTIAYTASIDGIFGYQFRRPVDAATAKLFAELNQLSISLRAAVDLPSGLGEETKTDDAVLRADFTYATGIVKTPLINGAHAEQIGRLRFLDLAFFAAKRPPSRFSILSPQVLSPLAKLRSPGSDKRRYGHVFILAGSRHYPGAALMSVLAALRSGAGLVTGFVPESLVPMFAAQAPEAMWVGWPETPEGGLALEGQHLLRNRLDRAQALVIGPGLGREAETLTLITDVVKSSPVPLVLDADALQPAVVRSGSAPRILTPHLGELKRILEGDNFYESSGAQAAVLVVKGRLTGITPAGKAEKMGYFSSFGGPVLARGGSGDLLSGITGRLLAETPDDPLLAACRAVVWHGLAADALAQTRGQVAVRTTELLDHLSPVLRELSRG